MTTETAVLGGGCFWCIEPIYQEMKGVLRVESGYTGGKIANPTYEQICEGTTGHAEVIRLEFDPAAPLVTELSPVEVFYKAESYHQNFYRENPDQGYCILIVRPKLAKFRQLFSDKLKAA